MSQSVEVLNGSNERCTVQYSLPTSVMRLDLIADGGWSRSPFWSFFQNLLHDTTILGKGNIDKSVSVGHCLLFQ